MTDRAIVPVSPAAIEVPNDARRLVDAFFRARNPNTLRAYRKDLADYAEFRGAADTEAAARELLASKPGDANALALEYRDHLVVRELTPATINRRLAALRSLVKLARMLGMVSWSIEVEGLDVRAYRDTKGPGSDKVTRMLAQLDDTTAKGARDLAIVRLLHDRGLRRGEVCALDREHYDRERGLYLLGKGRKQREWVSIPATAHVAMGRWLEVRGDEPGPLFQALDRAHYGHRLTGTAIWLVIRKLGLRIGAVVRPHGLRHSGITTALDRTGGDVRKVRAFSRHARLDTLLIYDDARRDMGGEVAELVSGAPAAVPGHWQAFQAFFRARLEGDPAQAGSRVVAAFLARQDDWQAVWAELWPMISTKEHPWDSEKVRSVQVELRRLLVSRR